MAGECRKGLAFREGRAKIRRLSHLRTPIESRWFALADLACAAIAAAWWSLSRQAAAWPLVIALMPWGLRLAVGKFPVRRTPLDIPIVIFLLTAGGGVWAAYDRAAAWNKFWLIVAAIVLYYALAGQTSKTLGWVIGFMSLCGVAFAIFFQLVPSQIEPDTVAGVLAIILPFTIGWGLNAWHKHQRPLVTGALVAGSIMALTVLKSREHGVLFGFGILIVLLPLVLRLKSMAFQDRRRTILILSFITAGILVGSALIAYTFFLGPIEKIYNSFRPRLTGIINSAYLVTEFPFIGGGLGAYAGLYSRYMLIIPYLFQQNSHNLFLDVAIEQGWIGCAALTGILAGSAWIVIRDWANEEKYSGQKILRSAVLCGLFLLILHNITEDALYSSQGIVGLFVLPGLSYSVANYTAKPDLAPEATVTREKKHGQILIALSGAILVLAIIFWRSIIGAFYANLGAIEMSRVHLAGWPSERVEGDQLLAVIGPAESTFQKALQYNPNQATALYRLGMIASERREYERAKQYLSRAYEVYPEHYGIRKMLGYSYLWLGNVDKAAVLLKPDSETLKELDAYTYWWTTQNREDLSLLAQQLLGRLHEVLK
jgi:tetratricopeptide (TPR) repeat protein